MVLLVDQIINNRYRIDSLMGQGGFGAVYKAWDTKLNGPCALKENFDTSLEAEKQFAKEASILFNLRHPNLPVVFDYFSLPEQGLYLVMSFIEGEDLQQVMEKRQEPFPEDVVMPWIRQVCEALSYLHNQDPPIIHRDIKPANIRITPQGQAVLVDFGIAKIYDPKLKTTVGARAVTPGYSPPEQYGRGSTDIRTDVYALGATLYSLLTGVEPPDSVDLLTGEAKKLAGVNAINPQITPSIEAAIRKAMMLDREARYQNVDAFKTALLNVSPTVKAEIIPPPRISYQTKVLNETKEPAPVKVRQGKPLRLWQVSLVVLMLILTVGFLAIIIEPSRDWLIERYEEIFEGGELDYSSEGEDPFPGVEPNDERAMPEIRRFDVPLQNDIPLGDPDARVKLIEFGDFGCEECRVWQYEYIPRLREAFAQDVSFYFLDFPQEEVHPGAFSAALAANCAIEQGKYWLYLDRLFSWDHDLGLPGYFIYAEDLGMDIEAFTLCYEEEWYHEEVISDIEMAEHLGTKIVPTFFINGIRIEGLQPFNEFVNIIERELGWR